MKKRTKIIALTSAALMAAGAGAGIAYASVPDSDGTFHACVSNSVVHGTREMYARDAAADSACQSGYTEKTWNQTGTTGATGATGATGPTGPAGVTPTYYVADSGGINISAGGNSGAQSVLCSTGDKATGGGLLVNSTQDSDFAEVRIQQSFPVFSSGVAFGWEATAHNGDSVTRQIHVYAVCADVTP